MSAAPLSLVDLTQTPEPDRPTKIWLCTKNRLWDEKPRPACIGKGGHNARTHENCGWFGDAE